MSMQPTARADKNWLYARIDTASFGSEGLSTMDVSARISERTDEAPQNFVAAPNIYRSDDGTVVATAGSFVNQEQFLQRFKENEENFLQQLEGRGLVLACNPERGELTLATDRMGRVQVYYHLDDRCVYLSTSLDWLEQQIRSSNNASPRLDPQNIYNYTYFHMVPAPGSILTNVNKLSSASRLKINKSAGSLERYWKPDFSETLQGTLETSYRSLRNHLKAAVNRARQGRTGAFLSGGLDSSTVAGYLSEVSGGCDAYAIGFDAEGYDEMEYARITAQHFGIDLHEYYVTPEDVVEALPNIATSSEEPFGNSSALPAYFCARMAAADGIDTLLAGDGGDELFAGNERYAKQDAFTPWERIPGWLRSSVIEPVTRLFPKSLPLASKIQSYIRQANTALPGRLQYYNFLEQNMPEAVFEQRYLASINQYQPRELLERIYQTPADASPLNRMLFLDWQITLADNDLRKVNQACGCAGVQVAYPMLDDQLVAFSATVPSSVKLPDRSLRDYYKQALTGWLPDATIHKSKHGFGLPFGVWMRQHRPLQELAYDSILRLAERGIFKPAFLDKAVQLHRDGHASYYGELIWILMVLELWLTAHHPGYRHE